LIYKNTGSANFHKFLLGIVFGKEMNKLKKSIKESALN